MGAIQRLIQALAEAVTLILDARQQSFHILLANAEGLPTEAEPVPGDIIFVWARYKHRTRELAQHAIAERLPNDFDRTMSAHRNGRGDAADEHSLNPPHSWSANEDAVRIAAFRLRA